jgi:hypothetical protein
MGDHGFSGYIRPFMNSMLLDCSDEVLFVQTGAVAAGSNHGHELGSTAFANEEPSEPYNDLIEALFGAAGVEHGLGVVDGLEDLDCASVIRRIVATAEDLKIIRGRGAIDVTSEDFLAVLPIDDSPLLLVRLFILVFDDCEGSLDVIWMLNDGLKGSNMIGV